MCFVVCVDNDFDTIEALEGLEERHYAELFPDHRLGQRVKFFIALRKYLQAVRAVIL